MKEWLSKKLLASYPDWHQKPLSLTVQEMEDPETVIQSFFRCYDLLSIRICLKGWLNDTLAGSGAEIKDHIYTHQDIERLIEAIFLVHQSNKPGKSKKKKK